MTKLIVALDYTNPLDALEMTAKLRGLVDGFKINQALWSQSVYVKDYCEDGELFIDLKLWDTPNTIDTVLQKIVDKGATMTTLSTFNNRGAFEVAEKYSKQIKLLGVTYLTSWTSWELLTIANVNAKVLWRSAIDTIRDYGFAGVICSPKDLETVNPLAKNMIKVCPGIGHNAGQSRTTTPKEAKELGADYLIVGRSITQAQNPVEIIESIRNNLK